MDRWQGKVAVVTGASAGIGAAVCVALADAGLRVVGLARRTQLIDSLNEEVKGSGNIVSRQCDVGRSEEVAAAFRWVEDTLGCVHVLVNNAGVFHDGQITVVGNAPLSDESIHTIFDVNVKGPVFCTRHAVASMKKHGFEGHIITINSIAGHYVSSHPLFNVYSASKHAITAIMRTLAGEIATFNSKIKTTSVSPGLVATAMAEAVTRNTLPILATKDIADAVVYALSTASNVNIEELTVTPVGEKRL